MGFTVKYVRPRHSTLFNVAAESERSTLLIAVVNCLVLCTRINPLGAARINHGIYTVCHED